MNPLAIVAQVLRIAVPYLFAAAGGVIAERSGIISLTLEGYMLGGAFAGVLGGFYSGSPTVGVLCGIAGGVLLALIHAVASIRFRADQVVVGIAINLFATGITRFFLKLVFGSSSNSPRVSGYSGNFAGFANPLVWLGLLATPVIAFVLYRTAFGLRVRAAGENPVAASSVGIDVPRVRLLALAVSGAVCALGGVHLAFDQHRFESGMSGGRGFMALAAVVVAGWRAERAVAACVAFGALEALQIVLQDQAQRSAGAGLIQLLPYVATLVVLGFAAGRAAAPEGLGKHAEE
jgi:simple sugar transport system permease protein